MIVSLFVRLFVCAFVPRLATSGNLRSKEGLSGAEARIAGVTVFDPRVDWTSRLNPRTHHPNLHPSMEL